MNRQEVENKIAKMFLDIVKVAKDYYEPDGYFTCSFTEDYIHFNNAYWEHEGEGKIDASRHVQGGETFDRAV